MIECDDGDLVRINSGRAEGRIGTVTDLFHFYEQTRIWVDLIDPIVESEDKKIVSVSLTPSQVEKVPELEQAVMEVRSD